VLFIDNGHRQLHTMCYGADSLARCEAKLAWCGKKLAPNCYTDYKKTGSKLLHCATMCYTMCYGAYCLVLRKKLAPKCYTDYKACFLALLIDGLRWTLESSFINNGH
jgi:hypothetical protein